MAKLNAVITFVFVLEFLETAFALDISHSCHHFMTVVVFFCLWQIVVFNL